MQDKSDTSVTLLKKIRFFLLAAGSSSRMGTPKALLPIDNATVLEKIITTVRSAGIHDIVVVVAPDSKAIQDLCNQLHVETITNNTPEKGMSSSIISTIATWLSEWAAFMPADIPNITKEAIEACVSSLEPPCIQPSCEGPRHPVFLHDSVRDALNEALSKGSTLRDFLSTIERKLVPCEPLSQFLDMDTPDAYHARISEAGGTIAHRKAE